MENKGKILSRFTDSSLFALICNLLLVYAIMFVAHLEFLFENYSYFSGNLTFSHLCEMYVGSLRFDVSGILYVNILYIVLMLFPLHFKENSDFFIPSIFLASEHIKNLFSAVKSYCFLYFRPVAIVENPLDNPLVVALPVKSIEIGIPEQCFSKLRLVGGWLLQMLFGCHINIVIRLCLIEKALEINPQHLFQTERILG